MDFFNLAVEIVREQEMTRLNSIDNELKRLRDIVKELKSDKKSETNLKKEGLNIIEAVLSGNNFIRSKSNLEYPLWKPNFIDSETLCFTKQELIAQDWEVK